MSPEPLVSIVVPVYNGELYIKETIRSILDQSYKNIECIVVDDGSVDASLKAIDEFSDRIKLVRQKNQGQASAINTGFHLCNGEYIGYLSADDIIDVECIYHLMAKIKTETHSLPLVIFPRYRTIDCNGDILNAETEAFIGTTHMIRNFRCLIGPGAIFNRRLFQIYGGWDPAYKQIPDYVFWVKFVSKARFLQIDKTLASFRVHRASQTFAQSDVFKSDESVRFSKEFSLVADELILPGNLKYFTSSAYIYSSCLHFRASRYRLGIRRYLFGFCTSPIRALSFDALKIIGASIAASFIHFKFFR